MDERHIIARAKQMLAENEELFEVIIHELCREEEAKPNNGDTPFKIAKQVIEINGFKRGAGAVFARLKKYAGKQ